MATVARRHTRVSEPHRQHLQPGSGLYGRWLVTDLAIRLPGRPGSFENILAVAVGDSSGFGYGCNVRSPDTSARKVPLSRPQGALSLSAAFECPGTTRIPGSGRLAARLHRADTAGTIPASAIGLARRVFGGLRGSRSHRGNRSRGSEG